MENTLIQAVQMHPCLFDKSVLSYRNRLAKEKAWMSVAAATGASVEQCQSRWRSLRDRFVKESGKAPSGSAAKEIGGWQYMEAMAFLQRHVAPRRTLGNTSFVSKESFQSQAEHEVCESQSLFDNEDQTQFDSPIVTESSPPISSFEAHCVEGQTPSTSKQAKRKSDEDRLDKLYGAVSDWLQKSESTPKPKRRFFESFGQLPLETFRRSTR